MRNMREGSANANSVALNPGGVERSRSARLIHVGIAGVALALTGCAHVRYAPVYCLTPPQLQKLKDSEPKRVGNQLTGQAQDDLKTIAGSAVELREYSHGLLNVLSGCTEPSH